MINRHRLYYPRIFERARRPAWFPRTDVLRLVTTHGLDDHTAVAVLNAAHMAQEVRRHHRRQQGTGRSPRTVTMTDTCGNNPAYRGSLEREQSSGAKRHRDIESIRPVV